MKKFLYPLLGICLHLFVYSQIQAQTCGSDFTINTEITNSTCLSNGEIKVTLSGDTTNLFNFQYGLSSTNGFTINPQNENILRNIPPGTYQLTVRAFCKTDTNYDVFKNISNLVVGGNYKVPQVSFNANVSRKSYDDCSTGIIALNVTDGNGNFTFTISSAPEGITTPVVVVPTKKSNVYTLPGQKYPAGNYTIQVDDGCYTTVKEFTLGAVSGFPDFTFRESGFRPDLDNKQGSCSYIYWLNAAPEIRSDADYQRYCLDGMYEIGAAPAGKMPTNWTTWDYNSDRTLLNISPYNISDFYTYNSIAIYTRVKGCENKFTNINTYLKKPSFICISHPDCDKDIYKIYPWTDYDGMFCYPLNLTVKNSKTGTVVYSKSNWLYDTNKTDSISLDYNSTYDVTMTDQNGTAITSRLSTDVSLYLYFWFDQYYCDSYISRYYVDGTWKPANCYEWLAKVTITDPDGKIIQQETLTNSSSTNLIKTPPLEYDKEYTVKAEYPDGKIKIYTKKQASNLPTSYTLYLDDASYFHDKCKINRGTLTFKANGNSIWPEGTIFTITGPAGYPTKTLTPSAYLYNNANYYRCPITDLPPGIYTLTANHGCGTPIVATFDNPGVYDYKNFGYDSQMTCSGLKVTPKGTMTYQGQSIPTYFRLVDGPGGYEKNVVASGGSFTLSAPGIYVLRIQSENNINTCGIKDTTIVYTAPPLDIDTYATSAYVCVGETIGNITVKAKNGVTPYTYELWDKTNTIKENINNITTDGIAHFVFGESNETYTIRITDQCGNSVNQQIKVSKLTEARIVYAQENNICYGDTIRLHCVTLGQTTYNWTGPENFSTTEQNPKIANTTDSMTGWYKVSVKPEFCGNPVQDSVYIRVYTPLTAGEVTSDQSVCVRTIPPVLTSQTTGGDGSYTYQWQNSKDGVSGWTDIQGATSATYQPPVQLKSGINYYRKISSSKCGTVYSAPITLTTKPCYIPVNPHLRNLGQKQK